MLHRRKCRRTLPSPMVSQAHGFSGPLTCLPPSPGPSTGHRWLLYWCLWKTENVLPPFLLLMDILLRGPLTEGDACPDQPDTDEHRPPAGLGALHTAGPAWPAPGTGLGLPASTSVRGSACCQARPALADKILISLLRSPEWDPIFMSELGNELHLSSPFSMRKVSRRSG